jgi:hypothetical protein
MLEVANFEHARFGMLSQCYYGQLVKRVLLTFSQADACTRSPTVQKSTRWIPLNTASATASYDFRALSAFRGGIEKDTVAEYSGGLVPF